MSFAQTEDVIKDAILETREASPSHFLMKVESFSLLGKNGIHKYESGEFSAGGYKWRLVLDLNDSKHMSVHLTISDTASLQPTNWEVNAVFSIFLLNQILCNYRFSPARSRRFIAVKLKWGFPNFVSKKVLMDPSNGFLLDDNCVFGAEVFVVEKSAVLECLSLKNVFVPYMRDWKISDFSKLGDVWTSEQFVAGGHSWELSIYPRGKVHENDWSLAAYLVLIDSKRVNARFSIRIKNHYSSKHRERTGTYWFSPVSNSYGWKSFMELADSKYEFIVKDCCLLQIEISVQAVV